jgi:hypothetical protein
MPSRAPQRRVEKIQQRDEMRQARWYFKVWSLKDLTWLRDRNVELLQQPVDAYSGSENREGGWDERYLGRRSS